MPKYTGRNLRFSIGVFALLFAAPTLANDSVSWSDIDFRTCPLASPLRVADVASAINYLSLQGCGARIVASPATPLPSTPDVARIIGIRARPDADGKRARLAPRPAVKPTASLPAISKSDRAARTDARFDPHIAAAAQAYRIDPLFLHAIVGTESTYVPTAVSHAGAVGLMQIMPATGARFGVGAQSLYDPATNIETGARLLKSLQGRYGKDFNLILAAYNAGEGAVARYGNRIPPYRETQSYVVKVMGRYAALRGQAGL